VNRSSSSTAPLAIALLAVGVVLAGVIVHVMGGSSRETPGGRASVVDATGAPASRSAPASTRDAATLAQAPQRSAATERTAVSRVVRGRTSAGRDAFERARNLGAVFNALRAQGDPDALFFAQRALRECMPYVLSGASAGQPPALDRYRPAPPGDPMTARRQAAYAAVQARCSGFDLGADPWAAARGLREALLAASDPRATLEQAAASVRKGTAPAEAMDKVRALTADGDPYAIEQASTVMGALRGRYVFVLDGQVVKPDIAAAGWMLASCDAGRSCGDEWVQAPCAFLTECDARDLESSLQR